MGFFVRCLAIAGCAVALAGCSLFPSRVAVLWTNQPEFTTYTELFNAAQDRYKVQIVYKSLPAQSVAGAREQPDLVVGERISAAAAISRFGALDQIMGKGQIDPAAFYRELLSSGRHGGRQFLLPVSFDLPMILFHGQGARPGAPIAITLQEMKQKSLDFGKGSTESFPRSGFSPFWNPDFLVRVAEISGADFHQTPQGELAWDEQKLQSAIQTMREWVKEEDGGSSAEASFREKYLYDPINKLLDSGRILYYYMPAAKFFGLPPAMRSAIDFRWLADGNARILAPESVLYVGVPARAPDKGAAYAFLKWFFRPENQARILEASKYEHLKSFGIGNGFSALRATDERDFPQYYPELLGKIPGPDLLAFPQSLPIDWGDLETNVIVPWLQHEISVSTQDQSLDARLKAWRLQKPLQ